jgi:hypothetical protein
MSGGVRLEGFDALRHALITAPIQIRHEGMDIVRDETEGAAIEMSQAYARKTGTLAARVKTSYPVSGALIGIAQSTAPHSHLYEFGTKARRTAGGANRGTMPARPTTPAIAQRRRERMARRLIEMVKRFGFQVNT